MRHMSIQEQHLKEYPVVIELPVVWGEMDSFGHVNNIFYFRYFESARLAYFHEIGYLKFVEEHGLGPILASTNCVFKRALTYPDKIYVGTRVPEMSKDRFPMHYRIVSEKLQGVAAEGEGLIVSYNYRQSQKAPIPDEIRQAIQKLEKRVF